MLGPLLSWIGFGFLAFTVTLAPWLFGAWEQWWFWPFVVCLCLATACFGVRLAAGRTAREARDDAETGNPGGAPPAGSGALPAALAFLPFLAYAVARFAGARVYADAERSVLLFLTAYLVAVQAAFGFSAAQKRALFTLIVVDLALLGLYGVFNHAVTGSRRVLWAPGYAQYIAENRATGSYFCPDHFAGVMELAFGAGLALALVRRMGIARQVAGACLALLATAAVGLSQSRGGGLTLLAVTAAALAWGFSQWRPGARWALRALALTAAASLVALLWLSDAAYVRRFRAHFEVNAPAGTDAGEVRARVAKRLLESSRGRMIAAALRAWRTQPAFGIGPGMHRNLWPHFAPSPDGDRAARVWPTLPNYHFHSYEVHSDWVQLLEEYGLVGLILFGVPAAGLFALLVARRPKGPPTAGRAPLEHGMALAAIFAATAMGFHSLGDFNLQMPATTWLLAALVALPLAGGSRESARARSIASGAATVPQTEDCPSTESGCPAAGKMVSGPAEDAHLRAGRH